MSEIPIIKDAEMYQLLRDDRIQEFNEKKKAGSQYDLTGVDLRGLDLRGLDAEGIDFSNSYFRQAVSDRANQKPVSENCHTSSVSPQTSHCGIL